MTGLYPIIRRVRRPLLPVDDQAAPAVPAASPPAVPPPTPGAVPEPPAPVAPVAKPEGKRSHEAARKAA
jgi:hypothetical protein